MQHSRHIKNESFAEYLFKVTQHEDNLIESIMNEQKFEEIPKTTLKTAKIETIVRKNI